MKVHVRGLAFEVGEALREHAQRRVLFALGRFAARLDSVRVRLVDANGPRGGPDKVCRMVARLQRQGAVRVEETDADAFAAVARAAERLGRGVAREVERRRESRGAAGLVRA